MSKYSEDRIRIPAKRVDGQWEFLYGGGIPISDGAYAEIVVAKSSVADRDFLERLGQKSSYKIMDSGTKLVVAMTVKDERQIKNDLLTHLKVVDIYKISSDKRFSRYGIGPQTRFVEIVVGSASKRELALGKPAEGGVWLELEGMEPQGLSISTLILPEGVADQEVDSLNYAFTLLSMHFEPWRKSHTGNIYERVFYQEKNGKWYPLNVLRNAVIATEEHKLIKEQWKIISSQLNLKF
ncbi:hypothetical protein [uncultured Marinobacter sp.]|jgi:hypothetical protein|uniref:hypothetical protein n=1 Tax=uncultured Marinobacter sp. TaxID=187379 RepID=UPI0030DB0896|tara:strand:+ start:1165 stop:1878 length:714 start_codon:yes stop_codon:yes gene_type:complete